MDAEARETDYVPVVYGDFAWEGRNSAAGVWRLVLGHDLVVTGDSEETLGHILPRGSVIYLEPGAFQQSVVVGAVATCYPRDWEQEGHPVQVLAERVAEDRGWHRSPPKTLPELPF